MTLNNRGFAYTKPLLMLASVVLAIIAFTLLKVKNIPGGQVGVLETWSEGVVSKELTPKFYWWLPGIDKTVYTYDLGQRIYVMNNRDNAEEIGEGRKGDAYKLPSSDQQEMTISLRYVWELRQDRVVALHENPSARGNIEEFIIRTPLLAVVKNNATKRTALEAYSGEGLVKLQEDIKRELMTNPELNQYVRTIDFVIEDIGLDENYTKEIVARQIAVQTRLKNIEQTKAAEAAADKAKAEAQADYEKTLVEARRDKEKGILEAEKNAQQNILAAKAQAEQVTLAAEAEAKKVAFAAEAEKNRNVLIAQGEKEAGLARASAILALGEAEAAALKLKLGAYATAGAEGYVRIQVAQSMSETFKNIKGYLPESMSVNLLAEQYSKGVNLLVGQPDAK